VWWVFYITAHFYHNGKWTINRQIITHYKVHDKSLTSHTHITQTRKQSQLAGTSTKAMLFARWRHHIRFASGFAYAPFNAMVTKISKWARIQDSCRITPKIESLVAYAMPNIPSKFQKDPSITFWVILLTHRQTNRQTNKQKPAKT